MSEAESAASVAPPTRTFRKPFTETVQGWSDERLAEEIEHNERDLAVYQRLHKTLMDELVRRYVLPDRRSVLCHKHDEPDHVCDYDPAPKSASDAQPKTSSLD